MSEHDLHDYKLCYVRDGWAFFTTQAVSKQWGDDWNDAPYEHNAGDPHQWRKISGDPPWEILRVGYTGDFEEPCTWVGANSSYSVEAINKGVVPWIQTDRYASPKPDTHVRIWAGESLLHFWMLILSAGGEVYMPTALMHRGVFEADYLERMSK